ncbi:H-NS family nucleoid-associated regulatory protein [Jannaschia pohangensis]|uniref:DNA-binding protein H-NS n=1 Tax=Jannaschia pohangensis TaxID=390807 RepID=A0A1I3QY11_9RHOB|nr:H-NS histone family protein [Jannaschia pohangensis]SFJ38650.1 DNA-binding protein H-NS [Jannaschia pohangensis]
MAKLDKMTKQDLAKERKEAEARLKEIAKAEAEFDGRRLKELRAEIEAMLAKEGYSIAALFDGKAPKKGTKAKAAPKFRHPENASVTWSGRGRQPQWYKDAIAAGKTDKDLSV